jgi:Rrf2 family cysteine metabolism transcriptional repressor
MKLSTRTRYGMRALMDLTLNSKGQPVQLKEIAKRQRISPSYLEHLIIPLISAGLIKSTRGAKGGINLARPPQKIRLIEILEILEGPIAPVDCLKDSQSCPRSGICATQDIWNDLAKAMGKVLESNTLLDVANRQRSKETQSEMYYI